MALEVEAAQRQHPTRQAAPTKKDVRSEHLNALDGTESDETEDMSGDEPSEGDDF